MKIFLILFLNFYSLFSYSRIQSIKELIEKQDALVEQLKYKNTDCSNAIDNLLNEMKTLKNDSFNTILKSTNENFRFLNKLFQHRLIIRESVDLKNRFCELSVRKYFYRLRSLQDLININDHKSEQVKIKDFDFNKMNVPDIDNPQISLLNPNIQNYKIQPGDIMIAKGISFTSSTISQLPLIPSHFSHIALFAEHEGKLKTIEAYIGKGVDTYDYEYALKNENVRIMILRPKDSDLARKSSQYMIHRYDGLRAKNEKIKYDYDLNFEDRDRLTCAEVAVDAFKSGSAKKVILPEFRSEVEIRNKDFIQKLGLKNGLQMFPADLEFDTRFEIVLEWTNVRLLQESIKKDDIMQKVISDLNENKSAIKNSWKSWALDYLWKTRGINWLWPFTSKILGLPVEFDADVPIETIKLSLNLEKTGNDILEIRSSK